VDSSASTGLKMESPEAARNFGADLMVQFSPQSTLGEPGRGVRIHEIDRRGTKRELPRNQATLLFAPTYASEWFELRLARGSFSGAGRGRVMSILHDASGTPIGWSEPEAFEIPRGRAAPVPSDTAIPAKPEGTFRLVSFNVLRAGPMQTPAPFARVLGLLDPDAVIVQEWDHASAKQLEGWFRASLPAKDGTDRAGEWHALVGQGRGVGVLSRTPIEPLGPDRLIVEGDTKNTNPVRFIAGLTQTPIGRAALVSLHLKSGGSKDSPEDQRRMNEARLINTTLLDGLGSAGEVPIRIVGGDLNLVGSRPPLDLLRSGLDADASELAVAGPTVLGDGSGYTWADPKTPFSPGRLDYVIYSDSSVEIVNQFILDASVLSDAALAAMGLDRSDTRISDHLPVVVDFRRK
jgi:endonuclease/exonuclease/phosphatase family metal-dependent hydrolase